MVPTDKETKEVVEIDVIAVPFSRNSTPKFHDFNLANEYVTISHKSDEFSFELKSFKTT